MVSPYANLGEASAALVMLLMINIAPTAESLTAIRPVSHGLNHAAGNVCRAPSYRRSRHIGISMSSTMPSGGGRSRGGTGGATMERPAEASNSVKEMSAQMNQIRADLEMNEEAAAYMQALRGAGIRDVDFAEGDGEMRLVDLEEGEAEGAGGSEDRLPTNYEPDTLKEYFARRPQVATRRLLQLGKAFSGFMGRYLIDLARGTTKENEISRAIELREIITSLGPFYIKLGQALSIRPDILSPGAMVELQRLCDKVPSFDSKIAFQTMEQELGCPVDEVFSEITPEPLAAASLGQVYKATLRSNGAVVAVKVQRPGVLETVSLDLHLARQLGYQLRKIPFLAERTDLVALLDEFAYRFYDELDYVKECQNGIDIKRDMSSLQQVVVPTNYPEYTSRKVFVSEWIEGEKLSQSKADDVQELVNVGVTAYLTQLLDTGLFHADPHPGNLIRTLDGRLAILDFGLMTQITNDQKYGMIEAISHLVHRDYIGIGDDFKRLDFIPQEVDVTPIIPALTNVFNMALAGGGAKGINFQELASDLAQITFEYPFRIPPYFALIIRAIGVLEGIALVGNPGFAIVDEAYPYISKRLLTDESPRLREALRYMIYGKSNVFDVERLIDLLQALETFNGNELVRGTGEGGPGSEAREALRFLFGKEGEFFREFLLDEVVKGVDCVGRDAARELAFTVGLRGASIPSILRAVTPKLSSDDRKVVDNTNKLLAFLLGNLQETSAGLTERRTPVNPAAGLFGLRVSTPPFSLLGLQRSRQGSALRDEIAPVLRELGPEMREFGLQVVGRLTEKLATRLLRYTSDRVLNNYYGGSNQQVGSGVKGTTTGGGLAVGRSSGAEELARGGRRKQFGDGL